MSSFKKLMRTTAIGSIWNYSAFAVSKGLIFVSTIILARILVPDDFGLIALGLVIISYLDRLSGLGVGEALIYRQEEPKRTADVAFMLNVGTDFVLATLVFFCAPMVADIFSEPRLVPIIRVLAIGFFIGNLKNIPEAIIKKDLDFKQRFIPEIIRSIVKGGLAVGLAFWGYGVWSLVWAQVAGWSVSTLIYWLRSRYRPQLNFDFHIAKLLLRYSTSVIILGLLGSLIINVDYLIIGYRMGAQQLGYYTLAFRLPELIVLNICVVMSQVLFPAFTKAKHDKIILRSSYLTTMNYISLATIPASVGIFLIAPEFVQVFYTGKWASSIPLMQILSLYTLIYTLSACDEDVFKAVGQLKILHKIRVTRLFLTVTVLWITAKYGVLYLAIGHVLVTTVFTIVKLVIVSRFLAIRFTEILDALKPAVVCTFVMVLGTFLLRYQIDRFDHIVRLLLLIGTGTLFYVAALWFMKRELFKHAVSLIRLKSIN